MPPRFFAWSSYSILGLVLGCRAPSGGDDTSTTGSSGVGQDTSTTAPDEGITSSSDPDSSTSSSDPDSSTGEPTDPKPPAPPGLVVYITGNPEDADVDPTGPGLVLMGGGSDVDEAFSWWGNYIAGGDVVVIRTSGADGYNDYLYGFGNADSVETMLVTAGFASDPYVSWTLRHAEAIFMAGGDQATYLEGWKGTPVEDAIHEAHGRGAVIGGTSAGLAVLGEFVYAAYNDGVYSYEALEDPYNFYMTMERDFLALPSLAGIITDTHLFERDRMGRLLGFLARIHADGWSNDVTGIGVDEATAVLVGPDGMGTVVGAGHAYVVQADHAPTVCQPGEPLEYPGLVYHALSAGNTLAFPGAAAAGPGDPIAASGGVTIPSDPYP
ncbi:cyanophycinase [Paraliomyxa miuraensis]|uniref:cyanophycinase n=1 Tax=Paraliomyxa miuraensis TaxID=376150 RepID=UPI00224D3C76|nr:cyanophycinase [Paraliomyxa miuraensis]MCX4239339.1 cyanophycinase [Paraliomyxa miuraensis]